MLALNLANCWKILLFRLISRKLFINKNLNRFFRDHMLKTIKNYNNYTISNKVNNKNLGLYLAGLIKRDCSII
jgi:hypothetical protein